MAEKIETLLLIRSQIGIHRLRQFKIRNTFEVRNFLFERSHTSVVTKLINGCFIQLGSVQKSNFLRVIGKSLHTQFCHGFLSILNSIGIQLNPTTVWQFDKAPRGSLQLLQIVLGQLHTFLLPFG